jgi:hypothetical protein
MIDSCRGWMYSRYGPWQSTRDSDPMIRLFSKWPQQSITLIHETHTPTGSERNDDEISLMEDIVINVFILRYLWDIVTAYPAPLQRKFLSFVTGSDRVPATGLANGFQLKISYLGEDCDRYYYHHCNYVSYQQWWSCKSVVLEYSPYPYFNVDTSCIFGNLIWDMVSSASH